MQRSGHYKRAFGINNGGKNIGGKIFGKNSGEKKSKLK